MLFRFMARIIRQSVAQVAGLDVAELEREYGIKEIRPAKTVPAKSAAAPVATPLKRVIELLVLRPDLHTLIDRGELAAARTVGSIRQDEIALLEALLDAFEEAPDCRVGEYFRGGEFEGAVRELEANILRRDHAKFELEEQRQELIDSWQLLRSTIGAQVRAARLQVLQGKQNLSLEEQDE